MVSALTVFSDYKKNIMCITPINLTKETWKQKIADTYAQQQVPCGRCIECRKLRVNSWFVRLKSEKNRAKSAHFLTLTYDDENLVYSDNGNMSLNYKDTQDFWKRIRINQPKDHPPVKYFLVGEYGSKTNRPHYHAIVFNVADPNAFDKQWTKGGTHTGEVADASIFYTLKYALKSAGKIKKTDQWDDRTIEKALMSKGLGENYLTDAMIKHHKDDVSRGVTMLGNTKLPLPRYYRDKIFSQADKQLRNFLMLEHNDKRTDTKADPLFPQRVAKIYADEEKKINKTD